MKRAITPWTRRPSHFPSQLPRWKFVKPAVIRVECGHRGCSSMVEQKLPKLTTRVRFPSPAPGAAAPRRAMFCSDDVSLRFPFKARSASYVSDFSFTPTSAGIADGRYGRSGPVIGSRSNPTRVLAHPPDPLDR